VTAPRIKVDAVAARGAQVILRGDSYSDAYRYAMQLKRKRGLTFVHPHDDPDVIAGQGTIGMEILRQSARPIHAVFVAVGGGGLIGGIAAYIKRLRPSVRVIGVEPVDSDAMTRSLKAGRRVVLDHVGLFADAVAVKQVGKECFRLAREFVDEMVLVDTDEMCAAIKDVFEDTRVVLEPSGALAVAGAKAWVERHAERGRKIRGKTLVAVACGANANFDRLRFVAERAEVGEHREAVLAATLPERRGSFRRFCRALGGRNITEFNYRMSDPREAHIFVGVTVHDRDETARIVKSLKRGGFGTLDLSDDEVAKGHMRHMIGGHLPRPVSGSARELLYRFEFPERRGALMKFLTALDPGWNISLFNYRNLGADYGSILVGLQVPKKEMREFRRFLGKLGYHHADETRNPAYRLFLG
jgi:threonine dehydratase